MARRNQTSPLAALQDGPLRAVITGTNASETLNGTADADTISGLGGNDTLNGLGGDDLLDGGTGNDILNGHDGNDTLNGGAHDDTLNGQDGNDTLNGGTGGDILRGGLGDDVYVVDVEQDQVIELAGEGVDTVRSTANQFVLGANLENLVLTGGTNQPQLGYGNGLNNVITGHAAMDVIQGLAGDDTIDGGDGNDDLRGGDGDDSLTGGLGADRLLGGEGNDVLTGGQGADLLVGNAGVDSLSGGLGDDVYWVAEENDLVIENAGEGFDTVQAYVRYVLGDNVEGLDVMASVIGGEGNALANVINGNAQGNWLFGYGGGDTINGASGDDHVYGGDGDDVLSGGVGDDWLDSGLGADGLAGGTGNDTYVVDNAGDTITELAGQGTDTARSWTSFTLQDEVENLVLIGRAVSGTGNGSANVMTGNAETNYLAGLDGNDTLDGGVGADFLYGGLGDDLYLVDNANDQTIEHGGGGIDTVHAWIGHTLAQGVENLVLMGNVAGGGGNAGNNIITGNNANNYLYGYGGDDTLEGGRGADILSGGSGADVFAFTGGFGQDTILDFDAGPGLSDVILFTTDVFADFASVMVGSTDTPDGVLIAPGNGRTILIRNVTKAQLSEDDFRFVEPGDPLASDAGHGWLAPLADNFDPLVLPGEVGPKSAEAGPLICDAADDGAPSAFVMDTDTLLAGRDLHRLLMQPAPQDWVL